LAEAESLSSIVKPSLHPGVMCSRCKKQLGHEVRILCLRCENTSFCEDCNGLGKYVNEVHAAGHECIRLRDSFNLTLEKIQEYQRQVNEERKNLEHDSFSFQTWRKEKLKDDPRAFELIKKMLRKENEYRLGEYYLNEYKKSKLDTWKTEVTEIIQRRVVDEFKCEAAGIYETTAEGIKFLRAASGNYAHRIEEIKECANYVKYTHFCVRGPLRVGDYVDLSKFTLVNPENYQEELLSDWVEPGKPLVIISSSYT